MIVRCIGTFFGLRCSRGRKNRMKQRKAYRSAHLESCGPLKNLIAGTARICKSFHKIKIWKRSSLYGICCICCNSIRVFRCPQSNLPKGLAGKEFPVRLMKVTPIAYFLYLCSSEVGVVRLDFFLRLCTSCTSCHIDHHASSGQAQRCSSTRQNSFTVRVSWADSEIGMPTLR